MVSTDVGPLEPPEVLAPPVTTPSVEALADIDSIGDLSCYVLNARVTNDPNTQSGNRVHYYVGMQVDGFEHTGWYTKALPPVDSGITVVNKAGWGEVVDDGIGWELHRRLTKSLPEVDIFSHETEGVGHFAHSMSIKELADHGIDQMALHGLDLLIRFCQDRRVLTLSTSMSTVIMNRLLNYNLDQGEPVKIIGNIDYAPALVDPNNVMRDMGLLFGPELLVDSIQELIFKTDPRHLYGLMKQYIASRPKASNLLPMARQGLDLLHGTPEAEIERVVAHYPTAVIVGTRDSAGQLPMWHRLAEKHPDLSVHPVRNRGHGIALKPYEGARKITRTIAERGLLEAA